MKNLLYLMDHVLYQIFKIILIIKQHETLTGNPLIQREIENRITFKIKTGFYPETLTPGIMKLLGYTGKKITKD